MLPMYSPAHIIPRGIMCKAPKLARIYHLQRTFQDSSRPIRRPNEKSPAGGNENIPAGDFLCGPSYLGIAKPLQHNVDSPPSPHLRERGRG